ncbi:MAG: histidine phosphatase family protein [Rhodospirillales bacterium]|nr:histidine phosphatase family protein [Rhodospirillales bacterium]
MKTLYLLRHAKSSWEDKACDDFDRPLNKRGRHAAKAMGDHLLACDITPAQVLCSPSKRTRETLERVQRRLPTALPVRFEQGIYLAEPTTLLRRLRRLSQSLASVMIIGHNPGLEMLARTLTCGGDEQAKGRLARKFPTCALATLTADIEGWHDLAPAGATLDAFVVASDLAQA